MLVNQNLTKEEINNLLLKLNGYFKRLSPPTYVVLVGMAIGNLFFLIFSVIAFISKRYIISALILVYIILCLIYLKRTVLGWKKTKAVLLLENINNIISKTESYNITADDSLITINNTLFLKWTDIVHTTIYDNYIICICKDNYAFPVKLDDIIKPAICNILNSYNIDIESLNAGKEDKIFVKQTKLRNKKKYRFDNTARSIMMPIVGLCILHMLLGYHDTLQKIIYEDIDHIDYNPQDGFVSQMADTYDLSENASLTFDLYYQYIIQQDYNTMVKIKKGDDLSYKSYHNDVEICFFDDEEYNFGLKLESSVDTSTGNITYTTADKSVHIKSLDDGTFSVENIKSDFDTWRNKFFKVLAIDDYVLNRIDWFSKSSWGGITFHANWDETDKNICFNYDFSPDNIVYNRTTEQENDFLIIFCKKNADEIENIKNIYETSIVNASEISFSDLIEIINSYAVVTIGQ